jgi:uncharacterized protein YidB (DUF937 family)
VTRHRTGLRLADYLDQHGRTERAAQIPPPDFWAAADAHAAPSDQAALAEAAHNRGLYRDAAQLHKNAAAGGNLDAGHYLSHPPGCLRADRRPAHWAATHASPSDPYGVAMLLDSLREAGAAEQVTALLARDPAGHADLGDPGGVAALLGRLREAGATEQVTALLARSPAGHADLGDPRGVAALLDRLREAGAAEQAAVLLARDPAGRADLRVPRGVAVLLGRLREAGAGEQAAVLASRAAAHADLGDPYGVAMLLDMLREAGAAEQAAVISLQDVADVIVSTPVFTDGQLARCLDHGGPSRGNPGFPPLSRGDSGRQISGSRSISPAATSPRWTAASSVNSSAARCARSREERLRRKPAIAAQVPRR